jgi:hypothetical protein
VKRGEKVKVWLNYHSPLIGAVGGVYLTKELADQFAGRSRFACKCVEVETGEGLSESELKRLGWS